MVWTFSRFITSLSTVIAREARERQSQLEQQLQEAREGVAQSERRARDTENLLAQANDRVREVEGEVARLQAQLRESEERVRERGEGLVVEGENRRVAERRLGEVERSLREEEGRRRLGEERLGGMEERVRVAGERQREAEQRMVQAENTQRRAEERQADLEERQGDFERRVIENERATHQRVLQAEQSVQEAEQMKQQAEQRQQEAEDRQQQAEQRQREAISRSRITESRLSEETQRRMELEEVNRGLEAQMREVQHLAHTLQTSSLAEREDVFWRVEREEIHLSERELGRGGWAVVKVAEFRGLAVAAKCLHSVIISHHNRQLFVREMNMAAKLRHPHLVQFIGATPAGQPIILTELMSTSLRHVLETGQLQPAHISPISRSVALALNYMHLLRPDPVLHRDVSSANVLLNPSPDDGWLAKLSDYGSANFTRQVRTAGPGNPAYAAPEASNPRQQTPKMDVYSLGVLLIEMASGQFPDSDNLAVQMRGISPPGLVGLIRRCINEDPVIRPDISAVLAQL